MRNMTILILVTAVFLGAIVVQQTTNAVDGQQTEIRTGAMLGSGFNPRYFYVRQNDGVIDEVEESYAGDALAAQAEAFVQTIHGAPAGVDGEGGRRALGLALDVGRRVRERLQRFG